MKFSRARLLQLLVDAFVICLALAVAYAIRFEGVPPRLYVKQYALVLPYLVLFRMSLLVVFGVYRLIWRYISLRDLPRIIGATLASSIFFVIIRYALPPVFKAAEFPINAMFFTVPYGVLAVELMLTTAGLVAVRALWRVIIERRQRVERTPSPAQRPRRRALLVGAGRAGEMIAREVRNNPDVGFMVVGLLDDDARKHGTLLHGYRVLGGTEHMAEFADETDAQLVIISMAAAPTQVIRRLVEQAEACNLKVQITPGLAEILSGRVSISKVRDLRIEDLLGREPVQLEEEAISDFLRDKTVLVTGAGGSIGSEVCRQVARFGPAKLLLLDQAENPLFHINRELKQQRHPFPVEPLLGNVADRKRMSDVLRLHKPNVVFHAAAHKHVALVEANPTEGVVNNVIGSCNVAELADEYGAEAFVMISTDKAVNPTSAMGATKRLAEMCVQGLSASSKTRMITVRFGNVLGSEGSVVPIFRDQIARGGPVTVTDPEMKRYFMTIPEASQLVLQAATMGAGGEIFILEMGEPIKIVNLARDLIRLSGYKPDEEIKIEFIGKLPGEKLYEETYLSEENASKTKHPRIWIGKRSGDEGAPREDASSLFESMYRLSRRETLKMLASCVPEYEPDLDDTGVRKSPRTACESRELRPASAAARG